MSCYHNHIIERRKPHRGFTLIELLVVIVIIGILASMITVAATSAMRTANQATIKQQIAQVDGALQRYKQKYGEYPPDFSDPKTVMRHVRKRWPKFNITEADFYAEINNAGWQIDANNTHGVGYAGALALWLGGPFDNSKGMLGGWGLDPSNPFDLSQRETPMLELTLGTNLDEITIGGRRVYTVIAKKAPMVYFRPTAIGYLALDPSSPPVEPTYFLRHLHDPNLGCAVPYAKSLLDDKTTTPPTPFLRPDGSVNPIFGNSDDKITQDGAPLIVWHNPTSYQIIHPGLDKDFGSEDGKLGLLRVIDPANDEMKGITLVDKDNQANFGGTTIESAGN